MASTCSTRAGPTPIERAGGRYYPKLQVGGAVHAGAGAAPAGRRVGPRRAPRWREAWSAPPSSSACRRCTSPSAGGRRRGAGRGRLLAPPRHPVSLGTTAATRASTTSSARSERQAQDDPQGAARGHRAAGIEHRGADRRRADARRAGDEFYPFYRATVDKRWGSAYLRQAFFRVLGETAGRPGGAGHGAPRRALGRRRAQPARRRHALRPDLGLPRGVPVPAFRGLLLSGDRVRDRAWPRAGRGGRAGPHKLQRGYEPVLDLQRPLDPRSWLSRRGRAFLIQERLEMAASWNSCASCCPTARPEGTRATAAAAP